MAKDKISVVTVCFNCVGTIEKTIRSVIGQTYSNLEYIIIDGGSTDGTLEIINKYKSHISVIVSEPDKGIYDAMNKGILVATGEWIHFRNSGDYFLSKHSVSDVFKDVIEEDVDVIHGDCFYIYPNGYQRRKPAILSKSYKEDMPVLHPATFVRARLHKKMPFDLNYRSAADYNFFFSLCEAGAHFHYVPIVIATFAIGGFSSNWERAFLEDRRIQGRMNNFAGKCGVYYELWKRKLWKVTKGKRVAKHNEKDIILREVEYDY